MDVFAERWRMIWHDLVQESTAAGTASRECSSVENPALVSPMQGELSAPWLQRTPGPSRLLCAGDKDGACEQHDDAGVSNSMTLQGSRVPVLVLARGQGLAGRPSVSSCDNLMQLTMEPWVDPVTCKVLSSAAIAGLALLVGVGPSDSCGTHRDCDSDCSTVLATGQHQVFLDPLAVRGQFNFRLTLPYDTVLPLRGLWIRQILGLVMCLSCNQHTGGTISSVNVTPSSCTAAATAVCSAGCGFNLLVRTNTLLVAAHQQHKEGHDAKRAQFHMLRVWGPLYTHCWAPAG
jgi:hypothetical protein